MRKATFLSIIALLITGMLLTFFLPKKTVSATERRTLAAMPKLTVSNVFDGSYFSKLESYLTDHFNFRDAYRKSKAYANAYIFQKSDDHDIYVYDHSAIKMEYPQSDRQINGFIEKTNKLIGSYFQDKPVYFSVIPDKNYFAVEKTGHLGVDYSGLIDTITDGLHADYIDIFPYLSLDKYYATDTHWKQEAISDVAIKLASGMGNTFPYDFSTWKVNEYTTFYGVYFSRAVPPLPADTLKWLSSEVTDSAVVIDYNNGIGREKTIYTTEKLGSMDSYEVFLSGATPLCTINNVLNPNGPKLLIFRDSFASSIAPLMLAGYSQITLVDTRYMVPDFLPEFVALEEYDSVLFLYSTSLINQSDVLKKGLK